MNDASRTGANRNIALLYQLHLSDPDSLGVLHGSTRDIPDLNVLKCARSGVIVLAENRLPDGYYENDSERNLTFKAADSRVKPTSLGDDDRRFDAYKDLIAGAAVLDFGCGRDGFIQRTQEISKTSVGLEINAGNRDYMNSVGVHCVQSLCELGDQAFDLITMNHVFHYLSDPIATLTELRNYLKDDGTIIIEVPNAKDILLETFDLEAFKNFTFCSDSLILHTKASLDAYAAESGLKTKTIEGFQRYPVANHFNWLLNGKPAGQEVFRDLNDPDFHLHYQKLLDGIGQTDTLIGYFGKA